MLAAHHHHKSFAFNIQLVCRVEYNGSSRLESAACTPAEPFSARIDGRIGMHPKPTLLPFLPAGLSFCVAGTPRLARKRPQRTNTARLRPSAPSFLRLAGLPAARPCGRAAESRIVGTRRRRFYSNAAALWTTKRGAKHHLTLRCQVLLGIAAVDSRTPSVRQRIAPSDAL